MSRSNCTFFFDGIEKERREGRLCFWGREGRIILFFFFLME